jgi:hypothetical protein
MFRAVVVPLGSNTLHAYMSRDLEDVYTTVADLSFILKVQAATIRDELSASLVTLPQLHAWLTAKESHATRGLVQFAPFEAWQTCVQSRISQEEWSATSKAVELARLEPWSPLHEKRARSPTPDLFAEENSISDSSISSSSSDDEEETILPRGVPAWVLTDPEIPSQFSREDYTKSYALKAYDMPKTVKKELKKIRKWWTTERNAERKNTKAVQEGTADKREERILCFLGFVVRYKCLPRELTLTTALS